MANLGFDTTLNKKKQPVRTAWTIDPNQVTGYTQRGMQNLYGNTVPSPAPTTTSTLRTTGTTGAAGGTTPGGTGGTPGGTGGTAAGSLSSTRSSYDPYAVAGLKYQPGQGWVDVPSGADVTYDGATNTYYYHGQAIPENQLASVRDQGPGALLGGEPSYMSADDIQTNLRNLGFGQLPNRIGSPLSPQGEPPMGPLTLPTGGRIDLSGATVTPPPQITAPHVTAEQGGFADFDALEKSLYESQYRPVQRELQRQRGLADEQLAARLAQAGIAESGTGVGQRAEQADEFYRKDIAASEDAASKAAAQRYGMEFEQSMRNAELRQQASLSNAGFNLQAQVANANNLLQASISGAQLRTQAAIAQGQLDTQAGMAAAQMANEYQFKQAQNYLQTMGLNFEQEQAARQNYLQLLGLQQADLARMDASQLETLSLFYNTYLKEVALMIDAGRTSTGRQDAESDSATTSIDF
jgi:hypothetical protein